MFFQVSIEWSGENHGARCFPHMEVNLNVQKTLGVTQSMNL